MRVCVSFLIEIKLERNELDVCFTENIGFSIFGLFKWSPTHTYVFMKRNMKLSVWCGEVIQINKLNKQYTVSYYIKYYYFHFMKRNPFWLEGVYFFILWIFQLFFYLFSTSTFHETSDKNSNVYDQIIKSQTMNSFDNNSWKNQE